MGNDCAVNVGDISFTCQHFLLIAVIAAFCEAPNPFAWSTFGNLSECGLWWAVWRPRQLAPMLKGGHPCKFRHLYIYISLSFIL